jgi:hypothetical protein
MFFLKFCAKILINWEILFSARKNNGLRSRSEEREWLNKKYAKKLKKKTKKSWKISQKFHKKFLILLKSLKKLNFIKLNKYKINRDN